MGEPVDEEAAAWILPDTTQVELGDEFWKSCPPLTDKIDIKGKLFRLEVAPDVLRKISVVDLLLWGFVDTYGITGGTDPVVGLKTDPGVMLRPYMAGSDRCEPERASGSYGGDQKTVGLPLGGLPP